ncbi:anamorsin [Nematocida homosporus]|uniref:anamorsin n=1 Tax=Nematocida homosporus TaxID=1912981 RepID=UPI00221E77EA|nr:anamorsin [Nematocida homosporus]KAI5186872.1 anamorsin [Nematocida homosporus]
MKSHSEFVSDAELLNDEDVLSLIKPVRTTKARTCANCTCGKKESNPVETPKPGEPLNINSECGRCYLGDAFRCASCPHAGLPPFKPNEPVFFNLDD